MKGAERHMEYSFTAEQEQFREIVARFLKDKSPTTVTRNLMATDRGYDEDVWRQMCQELGLAGIHIPEAYGGAGFGAVELGIAMEEQGRALLCAPYLASAVMCGYAILIAGTEDQKREYLPKIADGSMIAALGVTESSGLWSEADIHMTAMEGRDGFRLNGQKRFVVDGHNANLFVVAARNSGGVSFFAVDAGAAGVVKSPIDPMDPTRKITDITLNNAHGELLGARGASKFDAVFDAVLIALANEMIGGAQALLDSTIEYANLRVQFGRTIGSFQGIKHRCADLLVQVELARSTAYQAAQQLADGENATQSASMAKAAASEAYLHAAQECIQFHGGIGFTWENDTHLWFKRAKSSEVFLGAPAQHRERMLQAMGV
jgi:alkylation response protein AidB-like acyl-CoA dehydrogenase